MRLKSLAKPLFIRRVSGDSMSPTLTDGQLVICSSLFKPKLNKVIVVSHNNYEKVKRLKKIEQETVFVEGDNLSSSTDSRVFGPIQYSQIIGRVILPRT